MNTDRLSVTGPAPVAFGWRDLRNWATSLPYWVAFGGLLCAFDPIQRLALRLSRHTHEQTINLLNTGLVSSLRLVGTTVQIKGQVSSPGARALLVVSNHQSMLDIPILHYALRSWYPRFIAKTELARGIPSVSYNLRYGENAVIDRHNPRQAIPELKKFAQALLKSKRAAVLFPEGTRTRSGALGQFHSAGLKTLLKELGPTHIVPIALHGTFELTRRRMLPLPWGQKVNLQIFPGVDVDTSANADALCKELHTTIASGLASF